MVTTAGAKGDYQEPNGTCFVQLHASARSDGGGTADVHRMFAR